MKINQPDQPVPGFLDGFGWFWMALDGFEWFYHGFWMVLAAGRLPPVPQRNRDVKPIAAQRCCCGLSRVPHSHARDAKGMPRG